MTEMGSTVTAKLADDSAGVGQVLPNRELFLRDGEVLVKGRALCLGNYRNKTIFPVVGNNELEPEWFATKDLVFGTMMSYLFKVESIICLFLEVKMCSQKISKRFY